MGLEVNSSGIVEFEWQIIGKPRGVGWCHVVAVAAGVGIAVRRSIYPAVINRLSRPV